MNKTFLAVGINHFKLPGNDLSGCIPDANAMGAVASLLGITTPNVLTDKNCTKKITMAWLNQAVQDAKAGRVYYIGFSWSGHGTHYPRPEEPDGLGEALVCYDIAEKGDDWDPATIIKDTELRDLLNQVPQTCLVEVWLDTCYSGGMDRAFGDIVKGHPGWPKNRFLHNPNNSAGALRVANVAMNQGLNSNVIMWCASSEAQTSEDAYISGGAHGAFTWYWTQNFKAKQSLSRVDLLVKTRAGLLAGHYDQTPRLKCWNAKAQTAVGK